MISDPGYQYSINMPNDDYGYHMFTSNDNSDLSTTPEYLWIEINLVIVEVVKNIKNVVVSNPHQKIKRISF